jgi:hypothetical protein
MMLNQFFSHTIHPNILQIVSVDFYFCSNIFQQYLIYLVVTKVEESKKEIRVRIILFFKLCKVMNFTTRS